MQKWEYRKENGMTDALLSELGEQGWVLVAVTSDKDGSPELFYFKRPKQ